ncbi:MAG TPA: hypothetical protein VJ854_03005 [Sphaerochaeta sp.]|nr:hypothetical protein [Sphaerochaeta sp.]
MKRLCSLLLLLLASLAQLSALQMTHLHLGLGNDWYTMGLGDNLDDGLSFGSHLMVALQDKVFLKVDALGFTDKVNTDHRYDQVNINLYTPLNLSLGGVTYTLTPLVGLSIDGDLGFDRIQNRVHQGMDRPAVHLPYDRPQSSAHLNLGSTLRGMFSLGWVQMGLEGSYLHTFGWEYSAQVVAVLKLGGSLTLKGGYSFMDDFSGGPAHQSMMDRLNGPTFSYQFDGGLLTTSWVYHKHSGSSYGVFGIDIMQLFQPDSYDHTDFTYSLASLYDRGGFSNKSFALAFGPVILQTRHKSGPMTNDTQTPNRRMTVASWMIGYQKEWEATQLIFPYMKALWGFQRFNLLPSLTTPMIEEIKGTVALETGIRFGRDGQWVAKNNSYRPRIAAAIQYVFDTKALKEVDSSFAKHVGPWIFLIGMGLDIGHDPH